MVFIDKEMVYIYKFIYMYCICGYGRIFRVGFIFVY